MNRIDLDHLTQVCGGKGVPQSRTGNTTTEYAKCVDRVVASEETRLPSTKPWWNPFGTDDNSAPRASATLDRIRKECGLPPS